MQLLLKLHTGGVECPSNANVWLCQTFIASVLKEIRGNKVKSPPTNAPGKELENAASPKQPE